MTGLALYVTVHELLVPVVDACLRSGDVAAKARFLLIAGAQAIESGGVLGLGPRLVDGLVTGLAAGGPGVAGCLRGRRVLRGERGRAQGKAEHGCRHESLD